jgi:aspartate racemase
MRTIGLLGGMSWVSTSHYYELLNRDVAHRLGDGHCAPLVIWQTDFDTIAAHQAAGEWELAGQVLADGATALLRAGAEVVGIGANTMHLVAGQLLEVLGDVPLVHVVDVVRDECLERGIRTLGVLGTSYTMESPDLYPPTLRAAGVEVLVPSPEERRELQRITYEELVRDIVSERSATTLRGIAQGLVAGGADGVVLACTEHGLLLRQGDLTVDGGSDPVPVLDSTVLHARALVDAAAR